MTGNEPPEDPSEAPTGYYDSDSQEEGDPERKTPWYRRPIISLSLAGVVLILVGIGAVLPRRPDAGNRRNHGDPDVSDDVHPGAHDSYPSRHDHRAGRPAAADD